MAPLPRVISVRYLIIRYTSHRTRAKGRLVDHLETLELLGTKTSEDGFRNWNQDIEIRGSLGDPDTSALKELLNNAARRALDKPRKGEAAGTPTPRPDGEFYPVKTMLARQAP